MPLAPAPGALTASYSAFERGRERGALQVDHLLSQESPSSVHTGRCVTRATTATTARPASPTTTYSTGAGAALRRAG